MKPKLTVLNVFTPSRLCVLATNIQEDLKAQVRVYSYNPLLK